MVHKYSINSFHILLYYICYFKKKIFLIFKKKIFDVYNFFFQMKYELELIINCSIPNN